MITKWFKSLSKKKQSAAVVVPPVRMDARERVRARLMAELDKPDNDAPRTKALQDALAELG